MEKLYHYLWKTGIRSTDFKDVDGLVVEVIDPGVHNHDAGPDFFNSKIKINGIEWVGNVEIHVRASDWYRHGHSDDPAYENVILHVVGVSDKRINRPDGSLIPQVELHYPESFFRTYLALAEGTGNVRCSGQFPRFPRINTEDWFESLSLERLQQKSSKVKELVRLHDGDWEQTAFILLARGLGFGLNSDPFESMAKTLPLRILHHHSDNILQLEALLFGQSAMLDSSMHIFDEYYQALCREYYFLARKYGLRPMRPGLWKYSRTRPQNFPHRRIAFLASACSDGFSLFNSLLQNAGDHEGMMKAFEFKTGGYWQNHYSFDSAACNAPTELSRSSRILLCINVGVPLVYAYASATGNLELAEKVLSIMQDLPAESNAITREWQNIGIEACDAARSQALIHLRKEYCDKNKCIYCRFGHFLLRKSISST